VHAVIPYGNKDSRVFPLEVYVDNSDLKIKGGMLARVNLQLGLRRSTLLVPKDSVITRGAKTYLFTVHDGTAKQVFVTTDLTQGDLIEVSGALEEGQMVVIRGNERIRDGQPVQVVPLAESPDRSSSP
jgi:membrane fusion protein, multidrug efflux system